MGTPQAPAPPPAAKPGDPIDLTESVAGEEDPGASIDIASTPAAPAPAPAAGAKPAPAPAKDRPGGD